MWKFLSAFIVGAAVAMTIYFGVALLTTWTIIHSGRSQSEVISYFLGLTIASLAIGVLAGWWWYGREKRRAVSAARRPY